MKIIHTSDWHLGKNLESASRIDEQQMFIDDFVKKDLIDEYVITIIPCILGEGISLFNDKNPEIKLKLTKHEVVNGMAILNYVKR